MNNVCVIGMFLTNILQNEVPTTTNYIFPHSVYTEITVFFH